MGTTSKTIKRSRSAKQPKTKICTKCDERWKLSQFPRSPRGRFGRHPQCKACHRQYWHDHHDERQAYKARYNAENREKVLLQKRISANNRRVGPEKGQITSGQWIELLERYDHRCVGCNKHESETKEGSLTIDHIQPIAQGGMNTIEDTQPLCRPCNAKKGQKTIDYRSNAGKLQPTA